MIYKLVFKLEYACDDKLMAFLYFTPQQVGYKT